MYGKGGWVFVPARHIDFPRVQLTDKQKRENARAEAKWQKACDKIRRIAEQTNAKAKKLGGWVDDDDYGLPPLVLPHDPEAYDFTQFTAVHRAVHAYLEDYPDADDEQLDLLRQMVEAGVKVAVDFQGCSAGEFPPPLSAFKRDGPPVPDFINDNWWRPSRF